MKNYIIFFIIFIIFISCRKNSIERFTTKLNDNKNLLDVNKMFGKNSNFTELNNLINNLIKNLSIDSFLMDVKDENIKSNITKGVKLFFVALFGVINKLIKTNKCSTNLGTKNLGCFKIKSCNTGTNNCVICKKMDLENIILDINRDREYMMYSLFNIGLNNNEENLFKQFYINRTPKEVRKIIDDNGKIIIYEFNNTQKFSLNPFVYINHVMLLGKGTYLVKGLIFVIRLLHELDMNIWKPDNNKLRVFIAVLSLPALRWKELSKHKISEELISNKKDVNKNTIDELLKKKKDDMIEDFIEKIGLDKKDKPEFIEIANYLLGQDFFSFTVLYIDEKILNPLCLYLLAKQISRKDESYSFFNKDKVTIKFDKVINKLMPVNEKISALEILLVKVIKKLIKSKKYKNQPINSFKDLIDKIDILDVEIALTDIVNQETKVQAEFKGQMNFIGYRFTNFKPVDSNYNVVTEYIEKKHIQGLRFFKYLSVVKYLHENVWNKLNLKNYENDNYSDMGLVHLYNELVYASLGNKNSLHNIKQIAFSCLSEAGDIWKYLPNVFENKNENEPAIKPSSNSVPWEKLAENVKLFLNQTGQTKNKCVRWNGDNLELNTDGKLCSNNGYYKYYVASDGKTCMTLDKKNNVDTVNEIDCEKNIEKHYPCSIM